LLILIRNEIIFSLLSEKTNHQALAYDIITTTFAAGNEYTAGKDEKRLDEERRKMNQTKTLVALSLLVGIGAVLHLAIPGIIFNIKPDMMLTMMFLGIVFFPTKKNVLLLGVVTGVISGLTTNFPGGLLPNMIDKPLTAFIFFSLFLMIKERFNTITGVALLTSVGTIISGAIFLTSALVIVGLPASILLLFSTVVLPATLINTITILIIYPVMKTVLKHTGFMKQQLNKKSA